MLRTCYTVLTETRSEPAVFFCLSPDLKGERFTGQVMITSGGGARGYLMEETDDAGIEMV